MEGTDREGRHKHWLQKSTVDAERQRDASLSNAAATLENFKIKLAASREAFAPLEKAARSAFRGYGKFRRLLAPHQHSPEPALPADEDQLLEEFRRLEADIRNELNRFEKILLPRIFKYLPMWLLTILLLLAFGVSVPLLHHRGLNAISYYWVTGAALVFVWVIVLMIHQHGKRLAGPAASAIAANLAKARRLHDGSLDQAELRCRQEQERIAKEFENTSRTLNQQWKQTLKEGYDTRGNSGARNVDEKGFRALETNERLQPQNSNGLNKIARTSRASAPGGGRAGGSLRRPSAKMAKLNADTSPLAGAGNRVERLPPADL